MEIMDTSVHNFWKLWTLVSMISITLWILLIGESQSSYSSAGQQFPHTPESIHSPPTPAPTHPQTHPFTPTNMASSHLSGTPHNVSHSSEFTQRPLDALPPPKMPHTHDKASEEICDHSTRGYGSVRSSPGCSVLQCVAVFCSVLQCVAVCCSVSQCVAVCCNDDPTRQERIVFQFQHQAYVAVCCNVLQCVLECLSLFQRIAEHCNALHCRANMAMSAVALFRKFLRSAATEFTTHHLFRADL